MLTHAHSRSLMLTHAHSCPLALTHAHSRSLMLTQTQAHMPNPFSCSRASRVCKNARPPCSLTNACFSILVHEYSTTIHTIYSMVHHTCISRSLTVQLSCISCAFPAHFLCSPPHFSCNSHAFLVHFSRVPAGVLVCQRVCSPHFSCLASARWCPHLSTSVLSLCV